MKVPYVVASALSVFVLTLGCGSRGPGGPTPEVSVDWTQPSDDIVDYLVSESGEVAVERNPDGSIRASSSIAGFLLGDRIVLCMHGTCVQHQDLRVDDRYLYFVEDHGTTIINYYSSGMGRVVGTRWAPRYWHGSVGQRLFNWCSSSRGDCPPCAGKQGVDWQECAAENGYELMTTMSVSGCRQVRIVPSRSQNGVVDLGVMDWGGTIGRRHSLRMEVRSDASGDLHLEAWTLVRGAGVVHWEDRDSTGAPINTGGWHWTNRYTAPIASLGYNIADAHSCTW